MFYKDRPGYQFILLFIPNSIIKLDGETDWKLRIAVPFTQNLVDEKQILDLNCEMYAEKPQKDIHAFVGTYRVRFIKKIK
jgi:hypothetical protein